LLHADQPVSAERLALALWGEDAPAGAAKTVQVHVSRLRRALGDPDVLATTPAGYRLRLQPGELDAERFEQRVADGRRALAASHADQAAAVLREALALWRGPPLAELASLPFAPAEIAHLEEQRLAALELRVEAELAAGRHAELVGELGHLTREHPWRERLHASRECRVCMETSSVPGRLPRRAGARPQLRLVRLPGRGPRQPRLQPGVGELPAPRRDPPRGPWDGHADRDVHAVLPAPDQAVRLPQQPGA
jgi:hypothetical protein